MGINANVKDMIKYLAENDVSRAKESAKAVLANDKTASTTAWRKNMMNRLNNQGPTLLSDVPSQVGHMLLVEDVSETFAADRYYLTQDNSDCIEHIKKMRVACGQLGEMGIRYLNSTLLYGDSGCGKTHLARYAAHELGLPFATVNFAKLIDSYLGKTSQNLYTVFHFIKNYECVLLIDEIDAIGLKRTSGHGGAEGELNRVTITLMNELDKLSNDIVVIAATNRIEMLDEALMRRFSHLHYVALYDTPEQICAAATVYLSSTGIPYEASKLEQAVRRHFPEGKTTAAKLEVWLIELLVDYLIGERKGTLFD